MVRLVVSGEDLECWLPRLFQFLYGAIGGDTAKFSRRSMVSFNSYMVRLVELLNTRAFLIWPCFNSYMVRLVGYNFWCLDNIRHVSIPIWCDWWSATVEKHHYDFLSFNSYMVRLVAVKEMWTADDYSMFQFLYGAIGGSLPSSQHRLK